MPKRVTARDVAERAGVSRTTVSFVLNNVSGMRISSATRRRVIEAARQLEYHPNVSAQRLVTGQAHMLAYVERQSPESAFADAFLPQALRGVHDAASVENYEVLFAPVPLENGAERCMSLLRGGHVDGIILSGPRSDDLELCEFLVQEAHLVLQGRWPGMDVACVDIDNVAAAHLAVSHLFGLGHRRIGMIVHAPLAYTAAAARLEGYQQVLLEQALPFDEQLVAMADYTPLSGERAMDQLLALEDPPSAVFVSSDTVAVGAVHSAKRAGLRIPDDLALVGFDDIPMAVYQAPPLTTVRLPAYGLGWAAADLLVRLIGQERVNERTVLLEAELIVRASCGAN